MRPINNVYKPKVAIIMSTFNGERYLSEQIDSIIGQSWENWLLVIRDDGSTDSTPIIIEQYVSDNSKIEKIVDSQSHRGVKSSFLYILSRIDADYYMFCDQDDVWLPTKIERSLDIISQLDETKAAMVVSDLTIVDSDLNEISNSMWEYCNMRKKINNLKFLEVRDYLTGCTMLFNQNAKEKILKADQSNDFGLLHDQIATIGVLCNNGSIGILNESTILYRQHSCNVIGGNKIENKFIYRVLHIFKILKKEKMRYRAAHHYFRTSLWRFIRLRLQSID